MDTIKILPHHIGHYFEVHFLHRNPEEGYSWYDDKKFKQNGESLVNSVVSNPSQLVQIVSNNDSICNICPRNKSGDNYVQPEDTCALYEDGPVANELSTAKMLGIDDIIDKDPLTAKALFQKLKPVYNRIFTEEPNLNSKKYTPREYFRVSPVELMTLK